MIAEYKDLKPYKSLILAQINDALASEIVVEPVIIDLKNLLKIDRSRDLDIVSEGPTKPFKVGLHGASKNGQLHVKSLHYIEKRAPGWYGGNAEVQDTLNHLIVACQLNR